MLDPDRCFTKNDTVIYKELADGPALIDPYRRTIISLNGTALEIWRLLDGKNSVTEIISALRGIFDADEESLKKDVAVFLKDMVKRELVK